MQRKNSMGGVESGQKSQLDCSADVMQDVSKFRKAVSGGMLENGRRDTFTIQVKNLISPPLSEEMLTSSRMVTMNGRYI